MDGLDCGGRYPRVGNFQDSYRVDQRIVPATVAGELKTTLELVNQDRAAGTGPATEYVFMIRALVAARREVMEAHDQLV